MAPLRPAFKYHPADARFIGNPIDYIIFNGYTDAQDKNSKQPITIVFMDVKAGSRASLTPIQKMIKQSIEKDEIKWETLRLEAE